MTCRYFMMRLRRQALLVLTCGLLCTILCVVLLSLCGSQTDSVEERRKLENTADGRNEVLHFFSVHTNMIIVVISAPNNQQSRHVIRQTWASTLPNGTLVRFVVGIKNLQDHDLENIMDESNQYKDLIVLMDFEDSYSSLTAKVLSTIQWVNENVKFNFFMKVDEDSFVRVDTLMYSLLSKPHQRLYWGFFDGRAHVKKSGKWQERDFVLCDRYLPYALGGGYVLSKDLVQYLSVNAKYLKLLKSEDVSVGTWLAPLDINRVHDTNFDTEYVSRGCFNSYIVTHKKTEEEMHEMHENLKTRKQLCTEEKRVRKSYEYNWNELPTKCCDRVDPSIP